MYQGWAGIESCRWRWLEPVIVFGPSPSCFTSSCRLRLDRDSKRAREPLLCPTGRAALKGEVGDSGVFEPSSSKPTSLKTNVLPFRILPLIFDTSDFSVGTSRKRSEVGIILNCGRTEGTLLDRETSNPRWDTEVEVRVLAVNHMADKQAPDNKPGNGYCAVSVQPSHMNSVQRIACNSTFNISWWPGLVVRQAGAAKRSRNKQESRIRECTSIQVGDEVWKGKIRDHRQRQPTLAASRSVVRPPTPNSKSPSFLQTCLASMFERETWNM